MISKLFIIWLLCLISSTIASINKKDLKHIECDVCTHSITEIVKKLWVMPRSTTFDEVDRIFQETCDTTRVDSWIRKLDIITHESNRTVALVDSTGISLCGTECQTIRRKCEALLEEDVDRERAVDWMISKLKTGSSNLRLEEAIPKVCKEFSHVCPSKFSLAHTEVRRNEEFKFMTRNAVQDERNEQNSELRELALHQGITATFSIADDMSSVRAKLYYMSTLIGDLHNRGLTPQRHRTYLGHVWTVKINDKVVKQWSIGIERYQYFTLTWADVGGQKSEL